MEKDTSFYPPKLNLRNATVINVSKNVYSNYRFFFLRGHYCSEFLVISRKCYHLLKLNFHRLVLLYIIYISIGLKQSNGSKNQRYTFPFSYISAMFKGLLYILFNQKGNVYKTNHITYFYTTNTFKNCKKFKFLKTKLFIVQSSQLGR